MANADIVSAIIPFGSRDIARANEIIDEAGLNDADVADFIKQYAVDCDMNISDLDIVACVYEYILQNVRTFVEEKLGVDFLNENNHEIYVAGNYLATSYDFQGDANKNVTALIDKINEAANVETSDDDMPEQVLWFVRQIN